MQDWLSDWYPIWHSAYVHYRPVLHRRWDDHPTPGCQHGARSDGDAMSGIRSLTRCPTFWNGTVRQLGYFDLEGMRKGSEISICPVVLLGAV